MTYQEKRIALIEYLHAKVDDGDWHGVSDAANDLRVLEAQFEPAKTETATPLYSCVSCGSYHIRNNIRASEPA